MTWGQYIGSAALIVLGLLMVVDGAVMLVSPRKWCEMPRWLSGRGSLSKERYASRSGAVQIRIMGALFLVAVFVIGYRVLIIGD